MVSRDNDVSSEQQSVTRDDKAAPAATAQPTPEQQFEELERRFLALAQVEEVLEERQQSDRRVTDKPVAKERRKRQRRTR